MKKRIALVASQQSMDLDTDGPLLFPALERAGIDYEVISWDDPKAKWNTFDAVVLRAAWDYFRRPDEFREVLESIDSVSTLRNSLEVVEWNFDKRYLTELRKAGLPTVPTAFVSHLSPPTELASALARIERWETSEVVIKPTVSAGSNDVFRISAIDGSAISKAVQSIIDSDRIAMVQPYLTEVDSYGERGYVYVNGVFDHTFSKAAILLAGEQDIEGHSAPEQIGAAEPEASEQAVADSMNNWLVERFGSVLYARIDLLPSADGPLIVEVELIEPSLYFEADPPSADRFASALLALVESETS